jgi:hypothetical protein
MQSIPHSLRPLKSRLVPSGILPVDTSFRSPHAGKKLVISNVARIEGPLQCSGPFCEIGLADERKIFIPFLDFIARMAFSGFAEPTLLDLVPTLVGEWT